jgi:hypothetical protein
VSSIFALFILALLVDDSMGLYMVILSNINCGLPWEIPERAMKKGFEDC